MKSEIVSLKWLYAEEERRREENEELARTLKAISLGVDPSICSNEYDPEIIRNQRDLDLVTTLQLVHDGEDPLEGLSNYERRKVMEYNQLISRFVGLPGVPENQNQTPYRPDPSKIISIPQNNEPVVDLRLVLPQEPQEKKEEKYENEEVNSWADRVYGKGVLPKIPRTSPTCQQYNAST